MKYYAIKPHTIVTTWTECEALTKNVKGALFKSFKSEADARAWLAGETPSPQQLTGVSYTNQKHGIAGTIIPVDDNQDPLTVQNVQEPRVSVDGSFNQDTSTYGSGIAFFNHDGQITQTYRSAGNKQEYATSRNVAGEVVAFSQAIAKAVEQGLTSLTIICDYEGLFRWTADQSIIVRDKACWGNRLGSPIAELHDRALAYASSHGIKRIDYIWVRGHKGYLCNELVDQLAKEACGINA